MVTDELMDFLQDTVAKAPDLPPEGEPEAPKPKRQRYVHAGAGTQNDPRRQLHVSLSGVRLLVPVQPYSALQSSTSRQ